MKESWYKAPMTVSPRRREKGGKGPIAIGQSLTRLISEMGIGTRLSEKRAMLIWDEVVGPEVAQAARPDRVVRGSLHVRVKTATWRHALLFHRDEIRKKLNARLGEDLIQQIVLQ
jgi:predicted nucleic acid-binding Zn ribbon protein